MKKIITRFAPSPTGFLHFGNIRTALFSWLYSKKYNGCFYLRIDDTDIKRNKNIYYKNIIEDLKWLNINWEGNPILQSKKIRLYNEIANSLINNNLAYKCFCNKERLENIKNIQKKLNEKIKYDGLCRNKRSKKNTKNYVIRLKIPELNEIKYTDLNKGKIIVNSNEIDDFIIIKSNNIPTYNFSSPIDDIEMNITNIIRGEDHAKNTIKHILLIKILGKPLPKFIHLPLIINKNNKPLSKRDLSNNLDFYKKNGYIPDAILNYLLRLGWSYKNKEIFTIEEMIQLFNIENINKSPSKFDENKLLWINKQHIQKINNSKINTYIKYMVKKYNLNEKINQSIDTIINIQKDRAHTLLEMIDNSKYLFQEQTNEIKTIEEYFKTNILKKIFNNLNNIKNNWTLNNIKEIIKNIAKKNGLELKYIADQLRLILTGEKKPSPIFKLIYYIGYKAVAEKLNRYID